MPLDEGGDYLGRKLVFEVLVQLVSPAFEGRLGRPDGTLSGSANDLFDALHVPVHFGLHAISSIIQININNRLLPSTRSLLFDICKVSRFC